MMQSKKISQTVTILCDIPTICAASFIHRIKESAMLNGITISSSLIAAWVAEMVRVTQIFPSFATTFFYGHFTDHDLQ
jgi:hypothetical protein